MTQNPNEKTNQKVNESNSMNRNENIHANTKTQTQIKTQEQPSNASMAKSSLIMFAGTFVSRILGLIRSALLLAVLGAFGAHDAFNVANTLPNTIFNLVAGGVLNAILVPQIVRAFRKKNGDEFVNSLLTTTGLILLAITTVATVASSILVSLFAYDMSPGWKLIAISFAFWCMPQIFFYGLYVLYGQVLNAKYSFGPYMWSPVLNNIISILGLSVFIYLYGFANTHTTGMVSFWTWNKIALIAGSGTLGIVAQALILIPVIKKTGFKLRLVWHTKGYGLGHASKLALWAFGVVALSQFELLLISNLASSAQNYGVQTGQFIPSITVHTFAYLIYTIPQSLVTTSIITALFTRLSYQAANGEDEKMTSDYGFVATILGIFSIFASLTMIILSTPLACMVGPSRPNHEIVAISQVLSILCVCIPLQAFVTINARVLFAYEKTKNAFFIEIPRVFVLIIGMALIPVFFPHKYWVMAFCVTSCIAFATVSFIQAIYLKKSFPTINYTHIFKNCIKMYIIMLFSSIFGYFISNTLLYSPLAITETSGRFFTAILQIVVVGFVMLIIYITGLLLSNIPEVKQGVNVIKTKVFRR